MLYCIQTRLKQINFLCLAMESETQSSALPLDAPTLVHTRLKQINFLCLALES